MYRERDSPFVNKMVKQMKIKVIFTQKQMFPSEDMYCFQTVLLSVRKEVITNNSSYILNGIYGLVYGV
jgi:hypothetical protein